MKNDYRIKITKMMIRQSLLNIMKRKNLNKITVKELCQNAHINRATFYSHYENINSLIEEIRNEFSSNVLENVNSFTNQDSLKGFFVTLCNFVKNNLDYCEIIFADNGDNEFANQIIEIARPQFIKLWKEDGCRDDESIDFLYTFVAYGGLSVIKSWVQKGAKQSPEYIADFIVNNVNDNILKYR
ncbi:MAG: TetR-like C-terminal domain-containing protein [Eubacterium sp.]|nr:TetR-like C-terminal domain-containing protein [Eubacteriales bacterium]MDY4111110.1 TetR-like C-terminal domain-containing protein [Eubacterium sp.]